MDKKILRLPEVKLRTGLSRSYIYHLITQNKFPNTIKIGSRCVGWLESDINFWIESKLPSPNNGGQDE